MGDDARPVRIEMPSIYGSSPHSLARCVTARTQLYVVVTHSYFTCSWKRAQLSGSSVFVRMTDLIFAQAAIVAVKPWRYTPIPYEGILTVTVNFTMPR